MIEPVLSDEAFLKDVLNADVSAGALHLWWIGQSGYVMRHRRTNLVVDPYLSDSLTKKYAYTEKPHVRMHRRVIDPSTLGNGLRRITAITSSHAHTDHLDPETLTPLIHSDTFVTVFVTPRPNVQLAYNRTGAAQTFSSIRKFVGLNDQESWDIKSIGIQAVAASHPNLERDPGGNCKYLGYIFYFRETEDRKHPNVLRYITEKPKHEWTLYHSGDTVVYPGMVETLRPFNIDVAILPINGKVGNMGGRDAARLAKDIGARLVIPCHYDMFEFNTADPNDEFVPECQRLGQAYRVLKLGERFSSSEIP